MQGIYTTTEFDIEDLLIQVEEFINESDYPLSYNVQSSTQFIINLLRDPTCEIMLVYKDGVPAGFGIVGYDTEFHNERIGYVLKFYIRKFFRGTPVSRILSVTLSDWFDNNECVVSFVTSTAAIGEDQLFKNLMGKVNYTPVGEVLKRNKHVKI